jgi:hypothetical protein
MKSAISIVIGVVAIWSVSAAAQWPKYQTPGVPRDAQGRVIMNAPPPKTPDGKPDLSGNWVRGDRDPLPSELAGIVGNREGQGGRGGRGSLPPGIAVEPPTAPFPPDPNSPPLATFFELGANIPGGLPYTPWAADLKKQRLATDDKDNPDANCMPMGFTQFHMQPQPRKIIQTPNLIVILYEANYGLRYIYTDGRKLPPQGEPQPWWYGYSVGRWEGDTLVVDTTNFTGRTAFQGSSAALHVVERFTRVSADRILYRFTVDDPDTWTRPWSAELPMIAAKGPLFEYACHEGNYGMEGILSGAREEERAKANAAAK